VEIGHRRRGKVYPIDGFGTQYQLTDGVENQYIVHVGFLVLNLDDPLSIRGKNKPPSLFSKAAVSL
jgi:hypothetical protein